MSRQQQQKFGRSAGDVYQEGFKAGQSASRKERSWLDKVVSSVFISKLYDEQNNVINDVLLIHDTKLTALDRIVNLRGQNDLIKHITNIRALVKLAEAKGRYTPSLYILFEKLIERAKLSGVKKIVHIEESADESEESLED